MLQIWVENNGIEKSEDEVLADLLCNNTNKNSPCNSIF